MATQPGTDIARRADPNTPAGFRQQLRQNADKITLPKHISLEAFENVIFSATIQNPDLLKADRQSLLLACLKAAQDGLLPNGRDAALVTFNTRVKDGGNWVSKTLVQYMPMVAGLRSKILRAVNQKDGKPVVTALQVGVVYKAEVANGYFRYELGTNPPLQHRLMLEITPEEATDENIVAAYSIAFFADGTQSVEVMRRFEIDKVRQCSQTGALGRTVKFGADKGKPIEPKGPWVDWFPEMAKKTVLRRHSKVLPMAGDIVFFEATDEASEFDAANNVSAMLSTEPDAPRLADSREGDRDETLPPHDPETGELHEEGGDVPDKPRRGRPPKAQQEAKDENPTDPPAAKNEPAQRDSVGATDQVAASPGATPATTAALEPAAEEGDRDEAGVTRDPAEAKANEIIASMNKAEFAIDVEKAFDENASHIESMPAEIHATVMRAYSNSLRRVGARGQLHLP